GSRPLSPGAPRRMECYILCRYRSGAYWRRKRQNRGRAHQRRPPDRKASNRKRATLLPKALRLAGPDGLDRFDGVQRVTSNPEGCFSACQTGASRRSEGKVGNCAIASKGHKMGLTVHAIKMLLAIFLMRPSFACSRTSEATSVHTTPIGPRRDFGSCWSIDLAAGAMACDRQSCENFARLFIRHFSS